MLMFVVISEQRYATETSKYTGQMYQPDIVHVHLVCADVHVGVILHIKGNVCTLGLVSQTQYSEYSAYIQKCIE